MKKYIFFMVVICASTLQAMQPSAQESKAIETKFKENGGMQSVEVISLETFAELTAAGTFYLAVIPADKGNYHYFSANQLADTITGLRHHDKKAGFAPKPAVDPLNRRPIKRLIIYRANGDKKSPFPFTYVKTVDENGLMAFTKTYGSPEIQNLPEPQYDPNYITYGPQQAPQPVQQPAPQPVYHPIAQPVQQPVPQPMHQPAQHGHGYEYPHYQGHGNHYPYNGQGYEYPQYAAYGYEYPQYAAYGYEYPH